MRSEEEVSTKLGELKKTFITAERRFAKYDNYEDMDEMGTLRAQVEILNWVLGK